MTLVQLEYVIALDNYRNFSEAAYHCSVTQPTLSMQIQKIEQDLGAVLFDRSKQPIYPTVVGEAVIKQARKVLDEAERIYALANAKKEAVEGILRVGVLPTISTNLLPMFIHSFIQHYPSVRLDISEMKTEELERDLTKDKIDVAIMAYTDGGGNNFQLLPLFYEGFVLYFSEGHSLLRQEDIPLSAFQENLNIWFLEDGHCFKTQFFNFCNARKTTCFWHQFRFQSGHIETLKRLVDKHPNTLTVLPELSVNTLNDQERLRVRHFKETRPVRAISLVTRRNYLKQKLIQILQKEIISAVPEALQRLDGRQVISL